QRGPVVELPHQQPAAHVEANIQRRLVRLAHRDAVQLAVRAVVADLRHARLVVEQQEHAGDRGYHERIHRDLPEQRRPPVRPAPPVQPPRQGAHSYPLSSCPRDDVPSGKVTRSAAARPVILDTPAAQENRTQGTPAPTASPYSCTGPTSWCAGPARTP